MKPNQIISNQLLQAYNPCPGFTRYCSCMRWNPREGHVPRGFCGAIGKLSDVKLVLVCAEPGNPHISENHEADGTANGIFESVCEYVWSCFSTGKDLYHRNIKKILDLCFPKQTFDDQMTKTWITDSVLCSAKTECGSIPIETIEECTKRFLKKQISLFPNANIVALGDKADKRLKKAGIEKDYKAFAAAPPGCNRKEAIDSWEVIANYIKK